MTIYDLFVAVLREKFKKVDKLLRSGVRVNIVDSHKNTPLHYAVELGNSEICRILMDAGANLEAKNAKGKTPLDVYYENECANLEVLNELAFFEVELSPSNGSLFLATTLSYLIPVYDHVDQFKQRFVQLFGEEELEHLEYVRHLIRYYSLYFGRGIIENDDVLNRLTNVVLRNRLINYIPICEFENFETYQERINYLRNPNFKFDYNVSKILEDVLGLKNIYCHSFQLMRAEFLMDAWQRGVSPPYFSGVYKINHQDQDNGRTLLHHAICLDKFNEIDMLLNQGARVDITDDQNQLSYEIGQEVTEKDEIRFFVLETDGNFELVMRKFTIAEVSNESCDLENHENTYGPCSWRTLSVMNKLALERIDKLQYSQALTLYYKNMDCVEHYWGSHHPITLKLKMNMSQALIRMKKYDQVEELLTEVSKCETFRPFVDNHKAVVLYSMGLFQNALDIYDTLLEDCDPEDRMTFLHNKMCVLKACLQTMNWEEIVEFFPESTLDLETKIVMMLNVATEYRRYEEFVQATKICKRMYDMSKNLLSNLHPLTLLCKYNIGLIHYDKKNYKESLFHFERAKSSFGMALIKYDLKAPDEASEILEGVLRENIRMYGPRHPETLSVAFNLAFLLQKRLLYHESLEMYREVLNGREFSLSPTHEKTLRTLNNLGVVLVEMGQYKEAAKIFRKGVNLAKRKYFACNLESMQSILNE